MLLKPFVCQHSFGRNYDICRNKDNIFVQSLSHIQLFVTPMIARQAPLSFTISQSLLKLLHEIKLLFKKKMQITFLEFIFIFFYLMALEILGSCSRVLEIRVCKWMTIRSPCYAMHILQIQNVLRYLWELWWKPFMEMGLWGYHFLERAVWLQALLRRYQWTSWIHWQFMPKWGIFFLFVWFYVKKWISV